MIFWIFFFNFWIIMLETVFVVHCSFAQPLRMHRLDVRSLGFLFFRCLSCLRNVRNICRFSLLKGTSLEIFLLLLVRKVLFHYLFLYICQTATLLNFFFIDPCLGFNGRALYMTGIRIKVFFQRFFFKWGSWDRKAGKMMDNFIIKVLNCLINKFDFWTFGISVFFLN